jgi:hypothetical protein
MKERWGGFVDGFRGQTDLTLLRERISGHESIAITPPDLEQADSIQKSPGMAQRIMNLNSCLYRAGQRPCEVRTNLKAIRQRAELKPGDRRDIHSLLRGRGGTGGTDLRKILE